MGPSNDDTFDALLRGVAAAPPVVPERTLAVGDLVANRFEIVACVGAGGMGRIYRARDQRTGSLVAIKVLLRVNDQAQRRFAREGRVLAELEHPNIVGYVEHGQTVDGVPFLAMEWVEGEDLERRLQRGRLSVSDAVRLVRTLAEALAVAHRRNIIHRDVKPSNLLLEGGELTRVRLADFGLVSVVSQATIALTMNGEAIGTPSYMAPEQVRGETGIGPRADVFALGAVLFECLVGRPAFEGQHVRAVLAKILFEEAPRVSWHRGDVSPALDILVATMLQRDPGRRPPDADAILTRLDAIADELAPTDIVPAAAELPRLGDDALRWAYVVMAAPPAESVAFAETQPSSSVLGIDVDAVAVRYGGEVQLLADGTIFVLLKSRGDASDGAAMAARCALELSRRFPQSRVSLGALRSRASGTMRIGDLLERVAGQKAEAGQVTVNEDLANLLEARFRVRPVDGGRLELVGEDDVMRSARLLLGKSTPIVGRERELASLRATLTEVVDEGVARAALVTAGPGVGKTRLQQEVIAGAAGFEVWSARADMMSAGSSLHLLARVVRAACGVREADDVTTRRRGITARFEGCAQESVSDFLGELTGGAGEEIGPALRVAREDALLMAEGVRLAWDSLIDAATVRSPVLIILDDLHWADLPTLKLIDDALRRGKDRPLAVIAFGRPEVLDLFPRIWADRQVVHMPLGELTPRARDRLVRHVLGHDAPTETVARISELSAGNAFFLEELIRAAALGVSSALPLGVVAMVQSRLDGLALSSRRLLHLASVFGEVFWLDGVRALLPVDERQRASELVRDLVERELLTPSEAPRFAGETELAFRHALVREAAYASLSAGDLVVAHRIAADWLIAAGERDPFVLAEHLERAGLSNRASVRYAESAQLAIRANDWIAAHQRIDKGFALQPDGLVGARLSALQAEVFAWQGRLEAARAACTRSITALRSAGIPVAQMCVEIGWAAMLGGLSFGSNAERDTRDAALELQSIADSAYERDDYQRAVSYVTTILYFSGAPDAAKTLSDAALARSPSDLRARCWITFTRVLRERFETGNAWVGRRIALQGARDFESLGDFIGRAHSVGQAALEEISLGAYEAADEHAKQARALTHRLGIPLIGIIQYGVSALAAAGLGRVEEARDLVDATAQVARELGDAMYAPYSACLAACAARLYNDHARAIELATWAVEHTTLVAVKVAATTQLAAALLASDPAASLDKCVQVVEMSRGRVLRGTLDLDVRTTFIAAARALKLEAQADEAAARARALMRWRAEQIDDADARRAFLTTRWAQVIGA